MATTKESFIKAIYPYAVKASDILKANNINVDPRFIAAQWSHETGYGNNKGTTQNNLAGLYAYPTSPYGSSGKAYETLDDFIIDYTATLQNKRYSGINNAANVTDFAKALKAGGYATDPNYAYAATWDQAYNQATTLGATGSESTTQITKHWYDITDKDGNIVSWKDFLLGKSVNIENDGVKVVDNAKKTETKVVDTSNSTLDTIFDFLRLGFFKAMIFILVLLFLYASLIKGSTVDDIGKTVIKAVK